jgi:hypothetical protein
MFYIGSIRLSAVILLLTLISSSSVVGISAQESFENVSDKTSSIELHTDSRNPNLRASDLALRSSFHMQDTLQSIYPISSATDAPADEDLEEAEDVQITYEIRQLAVDQLKSDPLKIFLYVHNEIGYIPYGWSLQGSVMTLSTKYGNDYDQSSLLIALYRAAGIPARYMQAYVKVSPERMANWVGADDEIMPFWISMLSNMVAMPEWGDDGSLTNYGVIHCWVKAYIEGSWVELDPSFKEFRYYEQMDFSDEINPVLSNYSEDIESEEIIKINKQIKNAIYSKIESLPEDTKIKSIFSGQVIIKVDDYVSPPEALHPPKETSSLEITDRYLIAFMFPVSDQNQPFGFSRDTYYVYNVSTAEIAGKRITLSFIPESERDYDTINSYGNMLKTPCKGFTLKPVLLIDGNPVLVGDPMKPGEVFPYEVISYYPYYSALRDDEAWNVHLVKQVVSGSYIAISLNLAKIPLDYSQKIQDLKGRLDQDNLPLDDLIGEMLYGRAMVFWSELERYASAIAREYDDVIVFEAPGIVISGYEMRKKTIDNEEYLQFDKSIIDIHLATAFLPKTTTHPENVIKEGGGEYAQEDPKAVNAQFLYGIIGAELEGYIFYYMYNSPPTSALYLFNLASEMGIPIHVINSNNFNEEVNSLNYDDQTKSSLILLLRNHIEDNRTIMMPERAVKNHLLKITVTTLDIDYTPQIYNLFHGVGYLTLDEKGRFGSHTLMTYSGGFSGTSQDYSKFSDVGIESLLSSDEDMVLKINEAVTLGPSEPIVEIPQNVEVFAKTGTGDISKTVKKTVSTINTIVSIASTIIPPLAKEVGKKLTALDNFVKHGSEYRHYWDSNTDEDVGKIGKGVKAGVVFGGEVIVKGAGTIAGIIAGAAGGVKGFIDGFSEKNPNMPPQEAVNTFKKYYKSVNNGVNDFCDDVRRSLFNLDPNTGKPLEWREQQLEQYIPLNFLQASSLQIMDSGFSTSEKEWYTWTISSSGLVVGSHLDKDTVVTDMPNIYFDDVEKTINSFYIWNPNTDIYQLVISNQKNTNEFYVHIELSQGGQPKYEKIKISLNEGEEVYLPIKIRVTSSTEDMEFEIEEAKPVYTVAFTIDTPKSLYYEYELLLDDEYLTMMQAGTYKILAFEKDSQHKIRLKPEKIQDEEGDTLVLKPSEWAFSKHESLAFQYSSGEEPTTPGSYAPKFDQYNPYLIVIAIALIGSAGFLVYKKQTSRKKQVTTAKELMKYCISCGEQIRADIKYCTKCGKTQE